jgi:DNA-directed RNA polymerase subunit RPC12/RpoP
MRGMGRIRMIEREDEYECPECGERFLSKELLNAHCRGEEFIDIKTLRKEKRRYARHVLHENNKFLFRALIEALRGKK